jgi:hypothetical protein
MLQYGKGLSASDKGIYEIRANRLASPFPAHLGVSYHDKCNKWGQSSLWTLKRFLSAALVGFTRSPSRIAGMSLLDSPPTPFCLGEEYISIIAPFPKRGSSGKVDDFPGAFHINHRGFKRSSGRESPPPGERGAWEFGKAKPS